MRALLGRQFTRVFVRETGVSPGRAIEALRIEAARLLLEQSRLSMEEIAVETGFRARERMRRVLVWTYGEPPRGQFGAKRADSLNLNFHRTLLCVS